MTAGYRPCRTGLHVYGVRDDDEQGFTQSNLPMRNPTCASALFEAARAELACSESEPHDFAVELFIAGDHANDFSITRQMLPRLERLYRATFS
ncbi:hypothetical protein FHS96_004951 [Sphingomonas zeicaulis]|uniref:hypothetical protein n=1 Tax=Sphingomonas zeicaulis TaxID=1632740 RepID=UPI003D1A2D99